MTTTNQPNGQDLDLAGAVDEMEIPLSCGGPLCSPRHHHPLCKLAATPAQALYPRMPDGTRPTLSDEITFNTPIDYEGGENGDEARYIVTAAQLERLNRIEDFARAIIREREAALAGAKQPFTVVGFYPDTREFPVHHVESTNAYDAGVQAELDTAGGMSAVAVFAGHLDELFEAAARLSTADKE
jgi:hypothetical protein